MTDAAEKILRLLLRPNARYKFKHLVKRAKLPPRVVDRALAEIRQERKNLVFAKFDRTFFLSETPTQYSNQTDLSRLLPTEGMLGCLSDTHLCSNAERLDLVHKAYETFSERGVKTVLHTGDLMDGMDVYKGHNQNLKVHGGQAQAAYFIKKYPQAEGITTYAIGGNHDLALWLKSGLDQVSLVVNGFEHDGKHYEGRKDIVYLGQYSHRIILPQQVVVHMLHPRGSNAYARSWKQQKRSEAMDRNLRPDIQLSGHYHTYNYLWDNHTHFVALPGFQDETEFFVRQGTFTRQMGWVILHYKIRHGQIVSLSPELFMFA